MLQFFDDADDLDRALKLMEEHVMPLLEWIDEHEDPQHQVKMQTALFILLTKRAVLEHGLTVETATHIIEKLIPTILEDASPAMPSAE